MPTVRDVINTEVKSCFCFILFRSAIQPFKPVLYAINLVTSTSCETFFRYRTPYLIWKVKLLKTLEKHLQKQKINFPFLISNFHRVLNFVCFLLGNSPTSEFYMPTFRNTLFHLHRQVGVCRMNSEFILHAPTCL